ncbi:hypothetical protein DCC79_06205 [bacterium]|nr:MAG: hypothetical protein DCC79_06205 [bacterium]
MLPGTRAGAPPPARFHHRQPGGMAMTTTVPSSTGPASPNGTTRRALFDDPTWRWGNRLLGDPLLRADLKSIAAFGADRRRALERLAASLRDPRTRAEFMARAERRARDLRQQLADLRARGLTDLLAEAEQELSDQLAVIRLFAEPAALAG